MNVLCIRPQWLVVEKVACQRYGMQLSFSYGMTTHQFFPAISNFRFLGTGNMSMKILLSFWEAIHLFHDSEIPMFFSFGTISTFAQNVDLDQVETDFTSNHSKKNKNQPSYICNTLKIWFLSSENLSSPGGLLCLATFGLPKGAVCCSTEHVDPCAEGIGHVSRDKWHNIWQVAGKKKKKSVLPVPLLRLRQDADSVTKRASVCVRAAVASPSRQRSDSLRTQVRRHLNNVQNPQWRIILICKNIGRIIPHFSAQGY